MAHRPAVLLTGGGTAGHIYPLIAVTKMLPPKSQVHYFGPAGEYKADLKEAGIKVHHIFSSKMRRYFSLLNFVDSFKFVLGFFEALWKIYWFMPHAAFSKGGPGALAVVLACRFYRIPVVIHESDATPGLTQKASAKHAQIIEVAFPSSKSIFEKYKTTINIVGNPVREELLSSRTKAEASALFGLDPQLPTIMFSGGSSGAEAINYFVMEHLAELLGQFQVIHQVGRGLYDDYKREFEYLNKGMSPVLTNRYKYFAYLGSNYSDALDAADVVVGRAGAGQISDVAVKGKPFIAIPLPESANDHQLKNAYMYSDAGAAVVIEQQNFVPYIVLRQIKDIIENPERMAKMSEAAKNFFKPNAAELIAKDILGLIPTR